MADYPPYMNAYGLIQKILAKIKDAPTPERFTQDFLSTKLGFKGGSAFAFIPFAKRLGFLGSDGTPTDIYRRFRNSAQSGFAAASAMKKGYADLYSRNEYVHALDHKDLEGLTVEATGLDKASKTLRAIVASFEAVKTFAKFEGAEEEENVAQEEGAEEKKEKETPKVGDERELRVSYTFNLNLPETTNIAVFNAIFKALREHLLTK